MGYADGKGDICDLCSKDLAPLRRQLLRIIESPDLGILRQGNRPDSEGPCQGPASHLINTDHDAGAAKLPLEGIHPCYPFTLRPLMLPAPLYPPDGCLHLLAAVILVAPCQLRQLLVSGLMQPYRNIARRFMLFLVHGFPR